MTNSEVWMTIFLGGLFAYGAIWTFTHSARGISLISSARVETVNYDTTKDVKGIR